ncbi:MAG: CehA/McbA family metallohydrolase [Betaproteobacteria bacterium]
MRCEARAGVMAAAAAGAAVWLACSPAGEASPHPAWTPSRVVVPGAFHVHTTRSDGSETVDAVAAAASRAGLRFVLFTDHGDGTRPPEAPAYRHGVLCLDGVEVSTSGGHYVAFDLPRTPYPLAGDPRDVIQDVARLGGFGVAAHPDSPKAQLRWTAATSRIDGIEWLNMDSAWRAAPAWTFGRAAVTYFFEPPEGLTLLLARPERALARWDRLTRERPVVGFAATDAHGGLRSLAGHAFPSYEACFRSFTTRVELPAPLTGHAAADGQAITAALRAGHHYTTLDGMARPEAFEFRAKSRGSVFFEGDRLPAGPAILQARVDAPPGARIVLLRNGAILDEARPPELVYRADGRRAAYRVEVRIGSDGRAPWIASNPIYVGMPEETESASPLPAEAMDGPSLLDRAWHPEVGGGSSARVIAGQGGLRLVYSLGPGAPGNQFAAAVAPLPDDLNAFASLTIRGRSDRPVRMSVQLRARGPNPPRWWRSVYLDRTVRTATLHLARFTPASPDAAARPALARIGAIMLDVDVNHAAPGAAGAVVLTGMWLGR